MSVSETILKISLSALLVLPGVSRLAAQTDSTVVANVGGVQVTMAELEQQESQRLLSAHYSYYQAQVKALNDLIDKKLLQQKAASEHLTVDQLIDRDIKSQVKDPTEDQMKVYYEGVETEQPYEEVRGKILDKIREIRTNKALAAYVKNLRAQTSVNIALAPPRIDVKAQDTDVKVASNEKPAVELVEFADYECPYCQKVAADLKKLAADYQGKVTVVYKDFPLPMHTRAEKAAEAARCAGKQNKFWEFHDEIFRSKELDVDQLKAQARALKLNVDDFDKCLDTGAEAAAVERDRKEGEKIGISGTPSFFINGHYLSGALDYAALRDVVDQQLTPGVQVAKGGAAK
jgi:protein-disulfide isomerase